MSDDRPPNDRFGLALAAALLVLLGWLLLRTFLGLPEPAEAWRLAERGLGTGLGAGLVGWTLWRRRRGGRPTPNAFGELGRPDFGRLEPPSTLRRQEQWLHLALDAARMGGWEWDAAKGCLTATDHFGAVFGLGLGAAFPNWESFLAAVHPDDRPRLLRTLRRSLDDGGEYSLTFRVVWPDESVHWIETQGRAQRGGDGRGLRLVGVSADVTPRRQAQEALRRSEELYRSLVENSLQGMAIHQDGVFRYVSPKLAEMLGYTADELAGSAIDRIVAAEFLPELRQRWEAVLRGEALPPHPGWEAVRKDGSRLWLESRAGPVAWEGRPALLAVVVDVTQRKRLEEQLRQAQKMEAVGRLAGGVAHDFNNLLTVISCYAELLGLSGLDGDASESVREISRAAERAAELTRQLLAFSRRQMLRPTAVDLNEVVAGVEPLLRRALGEDVRLIAELAPNLGLVTADRSQLEQMLVNLAVYARDAMPKGGVLTLRTAEAALDAAEAALRQGARPGPYVRLTVQDTGCGMDEAARQRAFEPFFSARGPDRGAGLGLATVYAVVQQSGGHVSLASAPGQGALFTIDLPRCDEATPALQGPPAPAAGRGGTETLLVVEDEEAVRRLAATVLTGAGYKVLEARHGRDGLRVAGETPEPIHLVLTDVVMPEMSGREMSQRLAELRPGVPFLFMSGYTDDELIRQGLRSDGLQFLHKPFSPAELLRRIREVLDRA
jgi:PAS domain S-box-containing protein